MYEDDHVVALQQLSVFVENEPGRLEEVARVLADAGINLRALAIAETAHFGILRVIVDDTEAAIAALGTAGIVAKVTDVVGVEVPDRPGGLAEVLGVFTGTGVSIDYMYAELAGRGGRALLIMKLEPADVALRLLADAGLDYDDAAQASLT
jgi:hypothetical protein